jgi:predicted nucleic acid-binding protein
MSKERADSYTEDYKAFLVDVSLEDVKKAMDLKIKNKIMSIPDVIGYTIAKRLGVKFLTGDSYFEEFDNVELMKK